VTISEFSIIDRHFKSRILNRADVALGIGDDAAITSVPDGMQLVSAMDTLVSGVHFPADTSPHAIGHKALAVNLSDLAAMGAEPAWATLALTMPQADESWLKDFCDGFFQLAELYNVQLIGGDTTQGPLTVTVQVCGFVPTGEALLRSGAKAGDLIYVSGSLGDAALALDWLQNNAQQKITDEIRQKIKRLEYPVPRLELGMELRSVATAAIDISDGLAADLSHILDASGAGATIFQEKIPCDFGTPMFSTDKTLNCALYGGDDYEICFTAAENSRNTIDTIAQQLNLVVTEIGIVEQQRNIRLSVKGVCTDLSVLGYEHFSKS